MYKKAWDWSNFGFCMSTSVLHSVFHGASLAEIQLDVFVVSSCLILCLNTKAQLWLAQSYYKENGKYESHSRFSSWPTFQWVKMFCFFLEDCYVVTGQRMVISQYVWEVICLDTTTKGWGKKVSSERFEEIIWTPLNWLSNWFRDTCIINWSHCKTGVSFPCQTFPALIRWCSIIQ